MTSAFDNLLRKFGRLEGEQRPPEQELARLSGHLPPDLVAFWRAHGIGMWLGGKFQFCLPTNFAQVSQRIFADDPQFAPDETHIVGFSAFGELTVWNERHQSMFVDLPRLEVRVSKFNDNGGDKDSRSYPVTTDLLLIGREGFFDVYEQTEAAQPLFARARKRLGPLNLGECYGFVPALALGGPRRLEHLEKLDALVHFTLLADLGRCRLLTRPAPGGGEVVARTIGG